VPARSRNPFLRSPTGGRTLSALHRTWFDTGIPVVIELAV
jgi:hypothetical protein